MHNPERCLCAQFQREADEIQDLLREARRNYTDEDWAYINRDIERVRAERDAQHAAQPAETAVGAISGPPECERTSSAAEAPTGRSAPEVRE